MHKSVILSKRLVSLGLQSLSYNGFVEYTFKDVPYSNNAADVMPCSTMGNPMVNINLQLYYYLQKYMLLFKKIDLLLACIYLDLCILFTFNDRESYTQKRFCNITVVLMVV